MNRFHWLLYSPLICFILLLLSLNYDWAIFHAHISLSLCLSLDFNWSVIFLLSLLQLCRCAVRTPLHTAFFTHFTHGIDVYPLNFECCHSTVWFVLWHFNQRTDRNCVVSNDKKKTKPKAQYSPHLTNIDWKGADKRDRDRDTKTKCIGQLKSMSPILVTPNHRY